MQSVDFEKLGKRVREYRKAAGLTQQAVAEAIEIEPSNMSHIERGTVKTSLSTLVAIANVLGVTLDAFLCDSLDYAAGAYNKELSSLLADCTIEETRIITAMVRALKKELKSTRKI